MGRWIAFLALVGLGCFGATSLLTAKHTVSGLEFNPVDAVLIAVILMVPLAIVMSILRILCCLMGTGAGGGVIRRIPYFLTIVCMGLPCSYCLTYWSDANRSAELAPRAGNLQFVSSAVGSWWLFGTSECAMELAPVSRDQMMIVLTEGVDPAGDWTSVAKEYGFAPPGAQWRCFADLNRPWNDQRFMLVDRQTGRAWLCARLP